MLLAESREIRRGTVNVISVGHDTGCPTLAGREIAACSCEIVSIGPIRELDSEDAA